MLPRAEVSIMTGHASIETAVQAMRLGAYDYITKPFRVEELKLLLQRMEEKVRLVAENQFLRERVGAETELSGIVGTSTPIHADMRMLARLQDANNQEVKVNVQVIAAPNRDLEAAYKKAEFRKDLSFRLNVVTLHLPSLRERRSDIHLLVHHFLDKIAPGRAIGISPAAMACMLQYDWPGNVRELENAVERAVTLGSQNTLELRDLPPAMLRSLEYPAEPEPLLMPSKSSLVSDTDLEEIEKVTIQRVFEPVRGDKMLAGKMLGISRATLYRKLKRYNIGMVRGA